MRNIWQLGSALLATIGLIGCVTHPDAGAGDLSMSYKVKAYLDRYMRLQSPMSFAVSADGTACGYTYCQTGANCTGQHYDAISYCQSASKGVPCKLYAIGKSVVWRGNTVLVPGKSLTAPPATASRAEAVIQPIAVTWAGFDEVFAGTATTSEKSDGGTISITLPGGKGDCLGTFVADPSGQWAWGINCTNGLSATGKFQGHGPDKGEIGQGKDALGREVTLTIGPKVR